VSSKANRQNLVLHFFAALSLAACSTVPCHAEETAVDLRPLLSPVQTQGKRNTCSAFASTALMEYLIQQSIHKPVRLSVSYTYWLGKTKAVDNDFLRGMYADIDGLAGFLAVKGLAFGCMEDAAWPYEPRNWEQSKDPRGFAADGKPLPERFTGTPPKKASLLPYKIKPVFIEKEKIADFILVQKKPVVFNVLWCPTAIDAAGDFRMPTENDAKDGQGHVILLVGFDKKTGRFLFRNSWGDQWGKKGYGSIPEEYVVKYYEVKKFEPLDRHDKQTQEFLKTAMMGVSGELIVDQKPF
jgi:hypothetical protein